MARALTGLLAALMVAPCGCAQLRFHRDTNAPGLSDVKNPPSAAQLQHDQVVAPKDPGENMLTLNPGVYGGIGGLLDAPRGQRMIGFGGVEVTVNRGCSPRSHYKDGLFVYPLDGNGLSLGWSFVQANDSDADVGPIYVEVSRFRLWFGAALGYAVDVGDRDHGPQASAWFGPYFVRARYLFDGGVALYFGGQLKIPMIWIWSR